ncbi:MAG: HD domain-containing protein [Candidatus Micrarchaeota archaeon]
MHVIKDAVHGDIKLSEFERVLIDTPEVQRLRGLKQLAMAYLVYPGANHSRFEHSLGTMKLASEMAASLGLGEDETKKLRAVALLHDVGHAAFSHESERIVREFTGKTHEQLGIEKIKKSGIRDLLQDAGFPAREIEKLFLGEGLGAIVSSDLGADRMDYLLRDSHYTGVAYGVIDSDRLIQTTRVLNGKLVVEEGGLEAAESLLIARFLMFSAVYFHHTVRIASAMLQRAIRLGLADGTVDCGDMLVMDDAELEMRLKESRWARELVERIENRKLLKRAYEIEMSKLGKGVQRKLGEKKYVEKIEREIGEKARAEFHVIVDVPYAYGTRSDVLIMRGGKALALDKVSDIVSSLEGAEARRKKIIVACAGEERKNVAAACGKIFGAMD